MLRVSLSMKQLATALALYLKTEGVDRAIDESWIRIDLLTGIITIEFP